MSFEDSKIPNEGHPPQKINPIIELIIKINQTCNSDNILNWIVFYGYVHTPTKNCQIFPYLKRLVPAFGLFLFVNKF